MNRNAKYLTIGIPTAGRVCLLRTLIESLLTADSIDRCEIIVAMTVGSPAEDEITQLCTQARARVLRCPHAAASKRNAILRAARQPFVLFVDDDCIAQCDTLTDYLAALQSPGHAPHDCFAGQVVFDNCQTLAWRLIQRTGFASALSARPGEQLEWAATANLLVPRQTALQCGGFNEFFPVGAGGEDIDFCLRLRQAGGRILPIAGATVTHSTATWRSFSSNFRRVWNYGRAEAFLRHLHPSRRRLFSYYGLMTAAMTLAVLCATPAHLPLVFAFVLIYAVAAILVHRSTGLGTWRAAASSAAADIYYWVYGLAYLGESVRCGRLDAFVYSFRYRLVRQGASPWLIHVRTLLPSVIAMAGTLTLNRAMMMQP